MRKSGRIDDDERSSVISGGVNAVDQLIFCIALEVLQLVAGVGGLLLQGLIDVLKSAGAVNSGLAGAEQIEVWAM